MFGTAAATGSPLDAIVHIIQVSLTPVFLLSGIATLLNVFSTRLARVGDRVDAVAEQLAGCHPDDIESLSVQLTRLHRRSVVLDFAVVLGAVGGAATCGAVLTLFIGEARAATAAPLLYLLFGLAVVCALGAIVAYTIEMLMSGAGIRVAAARSRREAAEGAPEDPAAEPVQTVAQSNSS